MNEFILASSLMLSSSSKCSLDLKQGNWTSYPT